MRSRCQILMQLLSEHFRPYRQRLVVLRLDRMITPGAIVGPSHPAPTGEFGAAYSWRSRGSAVEADSRQSHVVPAGLEPDVEAGHVGARGTPVVRSSDPLSRGVSVDESDVCGRERLFKIFRCISIIC